MNEAFILPAPTHADRRLLDYRPELELFGAPEGMAAWRDEYGEMDFAARLLEAQSPDELRPVLADIVGQAGSGRPGALNAPIVGVLDRAARLVFPIDASRAPADLKRKAAGIFGLELEGLSPEDKEFEVARRFVRLAGEAAQQAFARTAQPPQQALAASARRNAPGLRLQGTQQTGRWRRNGARIEVLDC